MERINANIAALDIRFDSDAGKGITIREYLKTLLLKVWNEGEAFDGKKPFGSSGWEYEIYNALILNGFFPGAVENGNVGDFEQDMAQEYVAELISLVFYPPGMPSAAASHCFAGR